MSIFRAYWSLPPSSAVVPPQPGTGTGAITTLESRAGTLIHEVCTTSHNHPNKSEILTCRVKLFHYTFVIPFSTGQSNDPHYAERYGQDNCLALAVSDPNVAVLNPESLMYYALGMCRSNSCSSIEDPTPRRNLVAARSLH